jgi:hypothetical protein
MLEVFSTGEYNNYNTLSSECEYIPDICASFLDIYSNVNLNSVNQ